MKREILCAGCAPRMLSCMGLRQRRTETGVELYDPYPGEHLKRVPGKLVLPCRCDDCGRDLAAGDEAYACSIWADYGGRPYFEWEGEYVEVLRG